MIEGNEVKVWDPFVRFFHWSIVATFAICFATQGEPEWLHVSSGYFITALVVLRVVWGFVGPRHARFSDFIYGPREVFEHLRDVASFRAKPYLGHDPAGGAMIVAMLLFLSLTVLTGMLHYGAEDNKGPFANFRLASLVETVSFEQTAYAHRGGREDGDDDHERHGKNGKSELRAGGKEDENKRAGIGAGKKEKKDEFMEEVHETLAGITLALVIIHILGVLTVSLQTRENLIMGMITGRKKAVSDVRTEPAAN